MFIDTKTIQNYAMVIILEKNEAVGNNPKNRQTLMIRLDHVLSLLVWSSECIYHSQCMRMKFG